MKNNKITDLSIFIISSMELRLPEKIKMLSLVEIKNSQKVYEDTLISKIDILYNYPDRILKIIIGPYNMDVAEAY
jgi:hypothetical protein